MLVMRLSRSVRSHFVTRMPEWGLSLSLLGFGAQTLAHKDAFRASPGYRLLTRFVYENQWGGVAVAISTLWLICLTINGASKTSRRWTPWLRAFCGVAASLFWATNGVMFLAVTPENPAVPNNLGYAVIAFATAIITAREIGVENGRAATRR